MRAENNYECILINTSGAMKSTKIYASLVSTTLQPFLLPAEDSEKDLLLLGASRFLPMACYCCFKGNIIFS